MYAINHAATALLLKKKQPGLPMWPLLISVQLLEILWVIFNYIGIEYYNVSGGKLHLNFLPYSHSVFSGILLAIISFAVINWVYKNRKLAIAFAVGVLSHIIIDMVFHEKDIRFSPFFSTPVWGGGIIDFPILDFLLELAYGLFCWWYFKGNKALLLTIILFNVMDFPMMMSKGTALEPFAKNHFLLPTVILFQIVITWYFVWRFSGNATKLQKEHIS